MAAVFVRFLPGAETGRLQLDFDGNAVYDWNVYIVASTSPTNHQYMEMSLDVDENGTFSLEDFHSYYEVTMLVVNNKEYTGGGSFSYAADVIQPYGVAVAATAQYGYSSRETIFPVVISNTSALPDVIDYSISDDLGWQISPESGSIALDPSTDSTLTVTVTVPQWTSPETVDHLELFAQSQGEPVVTASMAIDFEILLLHGDPNWDGNILVDDAVYLVNHTFKGGLPPAPELLAGDADCSGSVNVSDIVFLVDFIFKGGSPPPCNP
jgi:hypothetical protein